MQENPRLLELGRRGDVLRGLFRNSVGAQIMRGELPAERDAAREIKRRVWIQ
jgi:hypothetical protein